MKLQDSLLSDPADPSDEIDGLTEFVMSYLHEHDVECDVKTTTRARQWCGAVSWLLPHIPE